VARAIFPARPRRGQESRRSRRIHVDGDLYDPLSAARDGILDFVGDPVMPGCLGLDALWQLIGFFLGWKGGLGHGRALGSGEIRFTGQVTPDCAQVRYHVSLKRVMTRKLYMGIGDGHVEADGRIIYTGKNLRVGLFQTEKPDSELAG